MRCRILLLGVVATAGVMAGDDLAARKASRLAPYVDGDAKSPQPGGLGEVVRIQQLRGKAELNSGFNNVTLVVDAYGKKVVLDMPFR